MTRNTRSKATAKATAKAAVPEAEAEAPAPAPDSEKEAPVTPTPIQRPATPEEAQQLLLQQRGRAEVAVLKQRFAETDVAMTIAQAECEQLLQQNQFLQQENARLKGELAAATADEDKQDNPSTEPEDGQTTPADAASKSED